MSEDTRSVTPPIVSATGLHKSFHNSSILQNLDLDIASGEFVAVLGRSGSGKTTLLRILAGIEAPTKGGLKTPEASAVVFQEPRLMPWMRTWENVTIGLHDNASRAHAAKTLSEVGLLKRIDAWPSTLSGGEAQRAALARALIRSPRFLLLDEPFAALDALTRAQMQSLVRELHNRHKPAILLVTHDIDEALILADRIVILQDGRIGDVIKIDTPHPRLLSAPALQAARERIECAIGVDQYNALSEKTEHTEEVPQPVADHRRRDVLIAAGMLTTLGTAGITRPLWKPYTSNSPNSLDESEVIRVGRFRQGAPDSSFFKQAGVDAIPYTIRYIDVPSSNELLELISSGAVDLGVSANIPPIFTGMKDGSVRQIAAITTDPEQIVLVSRPDTDIHRPVDIRGKRVAYLPANSQHYFLLKLLSATGLSFEDIRPIALSAADAQAAFARGDIDAWAAGGWAGWDAQQKGANLVATGRDLIRLDLVVLANASSLKNINARHRIQDYLTRIDAVWKWSAQAPEEWARENARITSLPQKFFQNLKHPQFTLEAVNAAAIAAQQDIADTFFSSGALPARVDVSKFWDASIIE